MSVQELSRGCHKNICTQPTPRCWKKSRQGQNDKMQDVLKEVEVQEPRFISSLTEINGRYEGFDVVSPNEFEVVLYLNQMGVFNFVDDGSLPGMLRTLRYG